METNEKDRQKQAGDQQDKPAQNHTSQGHATGDEGGAATNSEEPTLRSATTDSSRAPKNSNDDLPAGGNIR